MKRSLIYLLVVIILAGWLGTLIARDPGYVLISYDGATLETGLWVMAAILLVAGIAIYYLLRLLGAIRGTGLVWQGWRESRRLDRSREQTARGMTLLQAGEYERAERFLMGGVDETKNGALNYIAAARAADALGDKDRRDRLLRQAVERDPGVKQAAAVARAEMSLRRRQWRECIDSLRDCDDNTAVVNLKKHALFELKDWQALMELMPLARKTADDPTEAIEFEKKVAMARLSEEMADAAREVIFKKLRDRLKKDPQVILTYCRHLSGEKKAESLLRKALSTDWNPDLVVTYGELGVATLDKRLKTARGWLQTHADDHALQLAMGEMYRLARDQEKARACFEKSLDIKPTARANERLGELLSFDGDYTKSSEYFRQALKLKAGHEH